MPEPIDLTTLFDLVNRLDLDPSGRPRSGMGETYLVRCLRDHEGLVKGCEYVLKQVKAHAVTDEAAIRRFVREGAVGAALQHPHIVPIYWVGTASVPDESGARSERLCVVMKHLLGGTLSDRLEHLRPRDAAAVFRHVVDAVAYMHEQGFVHHDIKAENVMFAGDALDSVQVIDFGLARRIDAPDDRVTGTEHFAGTPRYFAPEYITDSRRGRNPRPSHDVFALGVLLYRMVTRAYPFNGASPWEIMKAITAGIYRPPARLNRDVDRELTALIDGCLATDPGQRYGTAREVLANVDRYLRGEAVHDPEAARYRERFNCGGRELSLYVLIGGTGQLEYRRGDIVATHRDTRFALPEHVADLAPARLELKRRAAADRGAPFFDGRQMRVIGLSWGTTADAREAPIPLHIATEECTYFQTILTNADHDFALPNAGNRTIRAVYGGSDPLDFADSFLANPLCVNLSVVTADNHVFYCERGNRVGMNPGGYQPAVSGTGNPEFDVSGGRYDPFLTARREAEQEFLGSYAVPDDATRFFGFARLHHNLCPFLFGEIRVPLTRDAVFALQVQDRYETKVRRAVPLEPEPVARVCRALFEERGPTGGVTVRAHSTIFSLVMSLLYADPKRYYDEFVPLMS